MTFFKSLQLLFSIGAMWSPDQVYHENHWQEYDFDYTIFQEYNFQSRIDIDLGASYPVTKDFHVYMIGGVGTVVTPMEGNANWIPLSQIYSFDAGVVFTNLTLKSEIKIGYHHDCGHPVATINENRGVPGVPHTAINKFYFLWGNLK